VEEDVEAEREALVVYMNVDMDWMKWGIRKGSRKQKQQ